MAFFPPWTKLVAPILVIFIVKAYFDTNDTRTINFFRVFFLIGQLGALYSLFRIYQSIHSSKDSSRNLTVNEEQVNALNQSFMDMLKELKDSNENTWNSKDKKGKVKAKEKGKKQQKNYRYT